MYFFFFLLLAPHGAWGLHSLPPTNSVPSGHFSLTPCETHCLNLFLDFSLKYSLIIILTTWALLAVSHMILTFHVPILTEFFAFRKGGDDEFWLRLFWSFRLSVALVIGYRLLPWTLDSRFCVFVSVTISWFFTRYQHKGGLLWISTQICQKIWSFFWILNFFILDFLS